MYSKSSKRDSGPARKRNSAKCVSFIIEAILQNKLIDLHELNYASALIACVIFAEVSESFTVIQGRASHSIEGIFPVQRTLNSDLHLLYHIKIGVINEKKCYEIMARV